ncbi:MAG: hypothetical protein HY744_22420 [Deltaproteobacteria bacterium]|nr:hypothetical protein [Deltaproteobacteria bacterium]
MVAASDYLRALPDSVARWVPAALARPPAGVGGPAPSPRELVTRLVARVGKQVRRADADALSDFVAETASGPQRETARWILERGSGSRSWVVHRALRELGLRSRIAVAETQSLSSSPHFPAHAGRFRHPLVLVDLPEGRLWIDADVDGPPLPPGTVSPELRGRQALLPDAAMLRVDAEATGEGDEIDIRLRLDERGDGHGTFAALLRGRQAQQLAEALEVTVGSERQQLLRNVVLGWLPWADVREVALSSDEGSWQVGLRAEIDALGYGRAEGRDGTLWLLPGIDPVHAVFPAPRATTLGTRYLAQAERTAALAIDAPLLFHVHRRIELPPAVAVIHPAEALKIETAELEAVRAVTQSGGLLEDDFRLSLPAGTVDLDRLEGFARDVRRVDDGFRYGTRVGPKR